MEAVKGFNFADFSTIFWDELMELSSENTFQLPEGSDRLTELFPPLKAINIFFQVSSTPPPFN
jgi:hypothetical protein